MWYAVKHPNGDPEKDVWTISQDPKRMRMGDGWRILRIRSNKKKRLLTLWMSLTLMKPLKTINPLQIFKAERHFLDGEAFVDIGCDHPRSGMAERHEGRHSLFG